MTLKEYVEKNGERKAAIRLVDEKIYRIVGMTTAELPDTPELCCLYDEIEGYIKGGIEKNRENIKSILNEIDREFIDLIIL